MTIGQDSTAMPGNHPVAITLTVQLTDTQSRFIQSVVQTAILLYRDVHSKATKGGDEADTQNE
jgi:hypothetical protein